MADTQITCSHVKRTGVCGKVLIKGIFKERGYCPSCWRTVLKKQQPSESTTEISDTVSDTISEPASIPSSPQVSQ